MPLLQWTTVRLVVSENDGRRHHSEMEPQGRRSVTPLSTRRRNRSQGLGVHAQTVGLNALTIMARHRANGGDFSLDIPFYRTCPIWRLHRQVDYFRVADHITEPRILPLRKSLNQRLGLFLSTEPQPQMPMAKQTLISKTAAILRLAIHIYPERSGRILIGT